MIAEQGDAVRHRNGDVGPEHVRSRRMGQAHRTVNGRAGEAGQRIHGQASAIGVTTAYFEQVTQKGPRGYRLQEGDLG